MSNDYEIQQSLEQQKPEIGNNTSESSYQGSNSTPYRQKIPSKRKNSNGNVKISAEIDSRTFNGDVGLRDYDIKLILIKGTRYFIKDSYLLNKIKEISPRVIQQDLEEVKQFALSKKPPNEKMSFNNYKYLILFGLLCKSKNIPWYYLYKHLEEKYEKVLIGEKIGDILRFEKFPSAIFHWLKHHLISYYTPEKFIEMANEVITKGELIESNKERKTYEYDGKRTVVDRRFLVTHFFLNINKIITDITKKFKKN